MSKEEEENLPEYFSKYRHNASFFDFKYYNNKFCLIIEILLFILMMVFIIILAFEYILIVVIYFIGLYFHLSRHYHLKKKENS
jgi:prepilin signal peptidase PulO-like enzyme (type II secretory pathway)